ARPFLLRLPFPLGPEPAGRGFLPLRGHTNTDPPPPVRPRNEGHKVLPLARRQPDKPLSVGSLTHRCAKGRSLGAAAGLRKRPAGPETGLIVHTLDVPADDAAGRG